MNVATGLHPADALIWGTSPSTSADRAVGSSAPWALLFHGHEVYLTVWTIYVCY